MSYFYYLTARIDSLDARIALLTADMRIFAGELKIQAMADLIEALIERQQLIERRIRPLDEWMIKRNRTPSPFDFESRRPKFRRGRCAPLSFEEMTKR